MSTQALDDRGRTPRKLASRKEISKLLAAKEREAMLGVDVFTATERNDVESVRKYVASHGNLDVKGRNGMTALHVACFNGFSEVRQKRERISILQATILRPLSWVIAVLFLL